MMPYVSVSFDSRGVERMKEVLAFRESGVNWSGLSLMAVSSASILSAYNPEFDCGLYALDMDALLTAIRDNPEQFMPDPSRGGMPGCLGVREHSLGI